MTAENSLNAARKGIVKSRTAADELLHDHRISNLAPGRELLENGILGVEVENIGKLQLDFDRPRAISLIDRTGRTGRSQQARTNGVRSWVPGPEFISDFA